MKRILYSILLIVLITNSMVLAQPSNGLIGYWPFDGNANDQTSFGNNGILNGVSPVSDRFGRLNSAYSFDGDDDILISTIGTHSIMSISLWVKPSGNQLSWNYIFDYGSRRAGINFAANTSQVKYLIDYNTNSPLIEISPNVWHHIVLTTDWTNRKLNFYVDKVEYAAEVDLVNSEKSGTDLYIGSEDGIHYYFTGDIDDIRVYDRVLSELEVNELFFESATSAWSHSQNDLFYSLGNVGIGTSTPGYQLDVTGSINANSFFVDGEEINLNPISVWTTSEGNVYYSGNVGIGTTTPQNKLDVNGTVHSKEVKVDLNNWPDYVFDANYEIQTLDDLKTFIKVYKHLPDVPTAMEVSENGVMLGEMNKLLLKKLEEMTLYMINANERIKKLEDKITAYEN